MNLDRKKIRKYYEQSIKYLLLVCAGVGAAAVLFITFFIFQSGAPLFGQVSPIEFLFSTHWEPSAEVDPGFGILPFITGSIIVTTLALLIGVPVGIACAIYLAEIAKGRFAEILRRVVEVLAGIPSVVFGLFGMTVICPIVRDVLGGTGYNALSGSIILAIMILPTIISISEISIRTVPHGYKVASFGLGATHWQTITKVLLPAARSGIIAAIILGTGRAIGETMAVYMVAGNTPLMPNFGEWLGLTSSVRTLTMNIITDMSYASGMHRTALFTTSIVLFIFIMTLNVLIQFITRKTKIHEAT
ncbi:MAG: phosphate ABC transporter permease subunit PstC [Spirochaetales bacterium]|nr:phosphate ABC transporter permease subunit PstC [Spirochaetales bacterium]